jgi:hypothetical protein
MGADLIMFDADEVAERQPELVRNFLGSAGDSSSAP